MKTPRRLHFAVGTGLLTASLAAGPLACDKGSSAAPPEPPHVNEGPEPAPNLQVNPGPRPEPEPDPEPGPASNPGPIDAETTPERVPDPT